MIAHLVWLVPALPLLAAALIALRVLTDRDHGDAAERVTAGIARTGAGLSWLMVVALDIVALADGLPGHIHLGDWFTAGRVEVPVSFLLDGLSLPAATLVATLVYRKAGPDGTPCCVPKTGWASSSSIPPANSSHSIATRTSPPCTPLPLRPRPTPPVLASTADWNHPPVGRFLLANVCQGLKTVRPGQIKSLRIVAVPAKAQPWMNRPTLGLTRDDPGKCVLGTVPVEPDGSAHFRGASWGRGFFPGSGRGRFGGADHAQSQPRPAG